MTRFYPSILLLFRTLRLQYILTVCFLTLLASLTSLAQTTRYVSTTGTNANPATATSWATSTTDLQGAINASAANDQVWVEAGTYKPGGNANTNRAISFSMKVGVAIYGGFVGNEAALSARPATNPVSGNPSSSTLSGDIGTVGDAGDNSYHVIFNSPGLTNSAILDGFVITGGNASDPGQRNQFQGGGMYNNGDGPGQVCSPLIRNCLFQANLAFDFGGAIYNDGYNNGNSSPTLTNCAFQANSVFFDGGAIYNDGTGGTSNPTLTNCSFQGNSAVDPGRPNYSLYPSTGGAMYSSGNTSPTLTNCSFQGNSALYSGGAMKNNGNSSGRNRPTLTNCSFQGNSAGSFGGAIYNDGSFTGSSTPTLTNCSFQGNSAGSSGGAIYNDGRSGTCLTSLTNCVLFGNGGANTFYNNSASLSASYSLFDASVTGYTGSTGNVTVTVTPFAGNNSVALAAGSPAIDAGSNSAYTSINGPATDLFGNPRFYANGIIDMGAVEQLLPPQLTTSASPNPVCAGSTVALSVTASGGTSPYSYTWAAPAGITLSATSTSAVSASVGAGVSGTQTFTITATASGGAPISTSLVSVTVNAATFTTSNAAICQGQNVNLGNYTGNKSPSNGTLTYYTSLTNAQAATNALMSPLVTPSSSPTTYYARYDAAGCFSVQPITVTFKTASPAPPALTQTGHTYTGGVASVSVAQNSESVILEVPGCDGSVLWSGPNSFIAFSSTISVPTATTGSFTYSASCSSQTACYSGSSQATVTVFTAPTITLGTPGAICQDVTSLLIPYTATTGNPTAYSVSGAGISGSGSLSATSGSLMASLTSGFTGSFSVVVQTSQGQSSSATPGTVTVNPTPTATITPSAMTVCQGALVSLTASGGTSYQWNNGQTTDVVIIDTGGPSGNPGVGGGYSGPRGPQSVTVTNAAGCSASATITLTINSVPVASITPSSQTVCAGVPASLTASGGSVYQWNTGQTTAVISVTSSGTYSVTVSGTTGPVGETGVTGSGGRLAAVAGCYGTASATVTVTTLMATATASATTALVGSVVSLSASGGTTYQWSTPSGASFTSPATSSVVSASLTSPGPQTFTVLVTQGTCSQTASVSVSASYQTVDFSPTLAIDNLNFSAGGTPHDFIVNINEVSNRPSSGPIAFRIAKMSAFIITYSTSSGSSTVHGGIANSNGNWTFSEDADYITVQTSAAFPAFGNQVVGFSIARKGGIPINTVQSINITILPNAGQEQNFGNNIAVTSVATN